MLESIQIAEAVERIKKENMSLERQRKTTRKKE
jgi:hypothetical protein